MIYIIKLENDIQNKTKENEIINELSIDIESYYKNKDCNNLIIVIYDPNKLMIDSDILKDELNGLKSIKEKTFNVTTLIYN